MASVPVVANPKSPPLIGSGIKISNFNLELKLCKEEEINDIAPHSRSIALRVTPRNADPFFIVQSTAILKFIAASCPGTLLFGDDLYLHSLVDQWLEFSWNEIEVPYCAFEISKGNRLISAKCKESVHQALDVLNKALKKKTFLVGDRLTICDIAIITAMSKMVGKDRMFSDDQMSKIPHVHRWYSTVMNHNIVKEILQSSVSKQSLNADNSNGFVDASFMCLSVVNEMKKVELKAQKYRRRRIRIKELLSRGLLEVGKTVVVRGWLKTSRSGAKNTLLFLVLNDGSCVSNLQVVASIDTTEGFGAASSCGGVGACLAVEGLIIESPAKGQVIEMQASKIQVLGPVCQQDGSIGASDYPLAKKAHSYEFLRQQAHLRPRTNTYSAVMRIRNAMAFATHRFFNERGFVYVHTPILTGADCEGAGEQFVVTTLLPNEHDASQGDFPLLPSGAPDYSKDFFNKRVCLTVSGQLNVETYCSAMSDVYTFGPTFRAEKSHTSRHLAEFWMIEPEIAFADLEDDMNLAEDYLKYLVSYALDTCNEDLEYFEQAGVEENLRQRLRNVLDSDFVRITYTDTVSLLIDHISNGKAVFENEVTWGIDLASEHERYITEAVFKCPVIVTNYPKDIKAFYMKLDEGGKTVSAMDILVPKIGEIIGGSQREERFSTLLERANAMGLEESAISWYLDLRKFGTMKHAGFGLGFERLILFITGIENIRDVIPFPRYPGHCEF